MPSTRYFYFSASFSVSVSTNSLSAFGAGFDGFPTRENLHQVIEQFEPGCRRIIVLSISEMTKEEVNGLLPPGKAVT